MITNEQQALLDDAIANNPLFKDFDESIHEPIFVFMDVTELDDDNKAVTVNKQVITGFQLKQVEAVKPPTHTLSNLTITAINGEAVNEFNGKYYCGADTHLSISATLINSNDATADVNMPIIKLPVIKQSNDQDTDKEFYLTGHILSGELIAAGKFPESGNWKIKQERVNQALDRALGGVAPFHVQFNVIDILA